MTAATAARVKKRRHRAAPSVGREFRFFAADGLEVRNDADSDAITISGTPIMYDVWYAVRDLFGTFEERMRPGVVSDLLLAGCDTRFLFNHGGMPLARTTSGTLTLDGSSPRGLGMVASLDARSSLATDLAVAIERGDVNQMSCGFEVGQDSWSEDGEQRTITRLSRLFDVSAVTYPASPTTSIELAQRSLYAQPVESRARFRQLWVQVGRELRDVGASLSPATSHRLQAGLDALRVACDTEPDAEEPAVPRTEKPAEAPDTREERRAAADASYNDREQALSDALLARFGASDDDDDAYYDMWVVDAADSWVVWRVYGDLEPGTGLWRLAYTMSEELQVMFTGDPEQVVATTSYVPTVEPASEAPEGDSEDAGDHMRAEQARETARTLAQIAREDAELRAVGATHRA